MPYELMFDNGGGTTLRLQDKDGQDLFIRHYDDPAQVAEDLILYLRDGYDATWDGNELDEYTPEELARLEYDPETYRNGGARWFSGIDEIIADPNAAGWRNIKIFVNTLAELFSQE